MLNLKNLLILLIIGILAVATVISLKLISNEDDWICVDGEWQKHGSPSAPKPETGCGKPANQGLIKSYEGEVSEIFDKSVKIKKDGEEITAIIGEGVKILNKKGEPVNLSYLRKGLTIKVLGFGSQNDLITKEVSITKEPDVIIYTPQIDEEVNSPIKITGEAKGIWFFEASFPLELLDENRKTIAQDIAQAQDDWMTENYVPFKGEIQYSLAATTSATLIFKKDNPSGLPENEASIEIPLTLKPIEAIKVKAYFNNNTLDPEISCNKVFPVEREVPKTQAVAKAALEELLKGVSEDEKDEGYFTNINAGVTIQKLTIEKGIAKVDFSKKIEEAVGGSCRVSAIRAQITETLKQFSSVKDVVISVDGRTEDILQP